jgi:hypothetical protein
LVWKIESAIVGCGTLLLRGLTCKNKDTDMISSEMQKLIETVGSEATLLAYSLENGALRLHVESYDDEDIFISVRTDTVRLVVPDEQEMMQNLCHLELTYLEDTLNQEHGIYVPSSDFVPMMKETRKGASLVYGRRSSELKWLLSMKGGIRLIICTVRTLEDISWTVK